MKSLSIYRPEDEALLGLLDALESTTPGTVERSAADAAVTRWLNSSSAVARVDTVCSVLAGMDAQRQGIDAQLMRLRQIKTNLEDAAVTLKTRIAQLMGDFGVTRMNGTTESLHLHTNPPAVQFSDERLIPADFCTLHVTMTADQWSDIANLLADTGNDKLLDSITTDTPQPQKSLIKSVLRQGGGVPGAFLEQSMSVVRK